MLVSLTESSLLKYVTKQLSNFFPDDSPLGCMEAALHETLGRVDFCFSKVHDKYFKHKSETTFDHLNTDQYAMFLYFLSNTLYRRREDENLCSKVYYLNKVLHGVDAFYAVELPDIFVFAHPLGTILGRAKYGNYLRINQNVTVGSNHEVDYPVLGEYVAIYKGGSVLGKCKVGDNCKVSAHSLLMDRDLESNSIYIGTPSSFTIKESKHHDRIWDPKH